MRNLPFLFIASLGLFPACSNIDSVPAPVRFTVDKLAMDSQIKRLVPALAIEFEARYLIIDKDSGKSTGVTLICPDEVFNNSQAELKHLAYQVCMVMYSNSPKNYMDNSFGVTFIPGPIHVGIKSRASYSFYDLPNETQFPVDNNGSLYGGRGTIQSTINLNLAMLCSIALKPHLLGLSQMLNRICSGRFPTLGTYSSQSQKQR